jgi:hypothetical protein
MTGKEVAERIAREKREGKPFIKWWSKANDVVDFDLVSRFIDKVRDDETIDGFELLDMDQMWDALLSLDPDNLVRVKSNGEELIQWVWQDSAGAERTNTYPFTPHGLITLFDEELFS